MGKNCKVQVAGDTVEPRDGTVFVTDISYGDVAATQRVQYVVVSDTKALLVDGKQRAPAQ